VGLLARTEPTESMLRHWFGLLIATLLAVRGYRKRSLSLDGAGAAFAVGLVSFSASVRLGLTLIVFYLTSTRLTRIGAARKRKLDASTGEHDSGNRNAVQVFSNAGLATLVSAVYAWHTWGHDAVEIPIDRARDPLAALLQVAYLCLYACCNADTWASELGVAQRPAAHASISRARWAGHATARTCVHKLGQCTREPIPALPW